MGLPRKYTFLQKYCLLSSIMQVLLFKSVVLTFIPDNPVFKMAMSVSMLIRHWKQHRFWDAYSECPKYLMFLEKQVFLENATF